MIRFLTFLSPYAAGFVIFFSAAVFADNTPDRSLLEQKLAEVENIISHLSNRKTALESLEKRLSGEFQKIEWELENLAVQLDYPDYEKAVAHPGVVFDLSILQRIRAYQKILTEKTDQFEQALETLGYFEQRIIDAKKLLEQVSAMNIGNLVSMVENTIAAQETLFKNDLIPVPSIDEKQNKSIWESIFRDFPEYERDRQ